MKSRMTNNAFLLLFFVIALGGVHARNLVHQRTLLPNLVNATAGGLPDAIIKADESRVHCFAIARTDASRNFYGSNAFLSLHKPKAQGDQWTTGRIKLSNGPDSIDAGWMVYPAFFNDNEAHLYGRYNVGSKECLNTNCPGFVQVAKDIPLGISPDGYSIPGDKPYLWEITIEKHLDDGNWWLSITLDGNAVQIGYWPSNLFTSLKDAATVVEWGGEINNPGAVVPGPDMGTGFKAGHSETTDAFFEHVTIIDENRSRVSPGSLEIFNDCSNLYTSVDEGDQGEKYGRIVFYGGYK